VTAKSLSVITGLSSPDLLPFDENPFVFHGVLGLAGAGVVQTGAGSMDSVTASEESLDGSPVHRLVGPRDMVESAATSHC
jgi:hypothetical protein